MLLRPVYCAARSCQILTRRSNVLTSLVRPRFNSTATNTATTTTATPEGNTTSGWWTPEESKAPAPPPPETVRKVVHVGGIRQDGRSQKWFKEARAARVEGGYTFLLDERGAMTQVEPLVVPSHSLALAMAMEWQAQGKYILPDTLPLTRMATLAIDQMPTARERTIDYMVSMFETDLTCVRIDEDILETQKKVFTPMLDWFAEKFGDKPKVSILFGKLKHPPTLVKKVRDYISSLDDFRLQALDTLVHATRSVVLPLYLINGKIGVEQAINASRIEEDSQIAVWGSIPGTHDVDRTEISIRIATASLFWRLIDLDENL